MARRAAIVLDPEGRVVLERWARRPKASQVRPAFVRHYRRLARSPMLAAGMLLMKSAEFAAGAAGLAFTRLRRFRSVERGVASVLQRVDA